jgi:hypothetical protein
VIWDDSGLSYSCCFTTGAYDGDGVYGGKNTTVSVTVQVREAIRYRTLRPVERSQNHITNNYTYTGLQMDAIIGWGELSI